MTTIYTYKVMMSEYYINPYDGVGRYDDTILDCQLASSIDQIVDKAFNSTHENLTESDRMDACRQLSVGNEYCKYFADGSSLTIQIHDSLTLDL